MNGKKCFRNFTNALILFLAILAGLQTDEVQAQPDSTEQLIKTLVDDNFQTRQEAERKLIELGSEAIPALSENLLEGNFELRSRAERIIGVIKKNTLEQSIRDFLQGGGSLPGWATYRKSLGDSAATREQFVELFLSHSEFLSRHAGQEDPVELLTFAANKVRNSHPMDSRLWKVCLSLQVTATLPGITSPEELTTLRSPLGNYYSSASTRDLLAESNPYVALHRNAIVLWLQLHDPQMTETARRLRTALRLKIPEALPIALKCLEGGEQTSAELLRNSMTLISEFGDASQVAILNEYIDSKILVHTDRWRRPNEPPLLFTIQAGDLALASMVHLADQAYKDFGLNLEQRAYIGKILPVQLSGFSDEKLRHAAKQKWKKFIKSNPNAAPNRAGNK